MKLTKIMVGGSRDGWHDFNAEYGLFSRRYTRRDDAPCGDEPMLMFFTSGTSGYPKIAAHNYKYPLGHFITAKYWHQVNPDGLHLTISDTGWAKSSTVSGCVRRLCLFMISTALMQKKFCRCLRSIRSRHSVRRPRCTAC